MRNRMVPALAVGWGDVKKRVQLQEQIASVHQEKIKVGQGGEAASFDAFRSVIFT